MVLYLQEIWHVLHIWINKTNDLKFKKWEVGIQLFKQWNAAGVWWASAAACWTLSHLTCFCFDCRSLIWSACARCDREGLARLNLISPQSNFVVSNKANSRLRAEQLFPKAHSITARSHRRASLQNEAIAGERLRKDADKTDSLAFLKLRHEPRGHSHMLLLLFIVFCRCCVSSFARLACFSSSLAHT